MTRWLKERLITVRGRPAHRGLWQREIRLTERRNIYIRWNASGNSGPLIDKLKCGVVDSRRVNSKLDCFEVIEGMLSWEFERFIASWTTGWHLPLESPIFMARPSLL